MYLGTMWWIVLVIFATAVVVSVGTFLLQWNGCCVQYTDHTGGTHVRVQMGWGYGFDMHRGRHALDEVRRQRIAARQQALRASQPKGLPHHALKNLASFTIKNKDEPSTTDLDCTICQEDLCQQTVASLPCGHVFHKKCICTWLRRKATCPTCRLELTEEMLKVKQPLTVGLKAPMAADIETGATLSTDMTAEESNSPQAHAPTIVVIPTAHDATGPGTPAERQLNLEQTQDQAPRVAVLTEGSNPAPVRNQ